VVQQISMIYVAYGIVHYHCSCRTLIMKFCD